MPSRHTTNRPRRGDRVWYGKRLFEDKRLPNGTIFKLVWGDMGLEEAWIKFDDGIGKIIAEEFEGTFNGRIGPTGTWVIAYGKEHPALGTFRLEDGDLIPIKGVNIPDEGC